MRFSPLLPHGAALSDAPPFLFFFVAASLSSDKVVFQVQGLVSGVWGQGLRVQGSIEDVSQHQRFDVFLKR
jgi:hypothetical protein